MSWRAARPASTRWRRPLLALLFILVLAVAQGPREALAEIQDRAIEMSQAALGNEVSGLHFLDQRGRSRTLDEFRGQPVVLSLIFTACVHSCQVSTRQLDRVVQIARGALGQDSFTVLTVGFDQPVDTPEQMAAYARRFGITDPNWHFLSSPDRQTIDALMDRVGFLQQPSPRGFDHTVQVTILNREGRVWRQVYGEVFPTPQLVEPLKDLVFDRPPSEVGLLGRLGDRVRLFCTVYDAQGDRYRFDYSMFAGIFIGTIILGFAIFWLLLEFRRSRRNKLA
jgi:protein SCO1